MQSTSITNIEVTQVGELLYESASTRVVRLTDARGSAAVICKTYLGPDAPARLRNEKKLLARLSGVEGLAQLAERATGAGVLMLQDLGAAPLSQLLREKRFPIALVMSVALQLARSLAQVHRAGVIHRDINPGNILLSGTMQAVLIDFDLGVLAEDHGAHGTSGQIVGTLSYLAPEQTGRTGRAVDQRADLYALGATLYEIATGRPPFPALDTLQLIHDHLVREPVSPSLLDAGIPPALSAIILRLLAKAPEQRYQSAEGLLHDLQRLQSALASDPQAWFELGERDFPARLVAPPRLVGRQAELARLRAALDEAMQSPRRTVLIDGSAGVGKSALINEFRLEVAVAGGWFVQGKFDQYQQDGATTGALTQAIRALGQLLLTHSGDELAAQRQRILQAVGRNAGLLTRLPEFALLLGAQEAVPEVDPRQAELQLHQLMIDLLGAVTSRERVLVLVLDDLQWASAVSLRAFARLMNDADLRGLLLIGASRPEQGDAASPLASMAAQWRLQPHPPMQISLANLTLADMESLTGQMLRLNEARSGELAGAINALTGGNPFDTVEMINALRIEGVLSLRESGWRWDDESIRRFVGRGNVVDLLAARIARLPAQSRDLLEYMGCIGGVVEFAVLAAAAGLDRAELQERLRAPLDDGLVLPDLSVEPATVRFRHDRVQQAILDGMDSGQRAQRHLSMARRLARLPALESEAARHYLASVGELVEAHEQGRAAELFYALAQRLAMSATFVLAERYLSAADALLDAVGDPRHAALRRSIDRARHCALYGLGRVDEADPLFAAIQARIQDPLDLVDTACLQMKSLDMRGRMADAMVLGQQMLSHFGLHVPPGYADSLLEDKLDALAGWVQRESRMDFHALPQPSEPRLLALGKLLARMVGSALHLKDMQAYTWLLLEAKRLWVEHGPSGDLVACLGNMGGMLIGQRQDFRTAYDIARHLISVGEALGFEVRTATTRYAFAGRTCLWFEPLEAALDQARKAYQVVLEQGDPSFACYLHLHVMYLHIETAPTIDAWESSIDTGLALCRRTGNQHAAMLHLTEQRFVRGLAGRRWGVGESDDDQVNEQAFMARVGHLSFVHFDDFHAFMAMLWGDADRLPALAAQAMRWTEGVNAGFIRSMHQYLFVALGAAWQIRQAEPSSPELASLAAKLEDCRNWIARRAADAPANYQQLLLLVEAEQAWALGDLWKAAASFDAAVIEVETRERQWQRAFIAERAGLFYLSRGLMGIGCGLLVRARDHYRTWGASAKVDQLQGRHAFLRASPRSLGAQLSANSVTSHKASSSFSSETIDLVGLLQASQALSSETSVEQVTTRVTEVLASLSGATKVLVLSSSDGHWRLHPATPGDAPMPVRQAAEKGLLPLSAFAYAEQTGEALIVDDGAADDRFARDPYFVQAPICSLLLLPIAGQGADRAMLLLENRQGRAAFNAQRLDAVKLIAGQLTVSLANAQLYQSLEQRVQARTRELEQTQAQLVATARRAGMAEIATNVLHNVGNVLNSVNVSASVLRNTIGNSRIDGLTRAVTLINEHEHDLAQYLEHDPRGKALRPYLNELVGELRSERQAALDDLDRLSQSVDHITYVVATQQAHAGPSSLLEQTRPRDLIEDALHLSAEAIARHDITVIRRYEQVPATLLDRQRVVQILVNLIGNAAQAMDGLTAARRQLVLIAEVEKGMEGARLRLVVQDHGEGISAENLKRIFVHGFTTRKDGHGFGLHSSAIAATEMGGRLTVHSDGPGQGATFTLELPIRG